MELEKLEDELIEVRAEATRVQQTLAISRARALREWEGYLAKHPSVKKVFDKYQRTMGKVAETAQSQLTALGEKEQTITSQIIEKTGGAPEPPPTVEEALSETNDDSLVEVDVEVEPLWQRLQRGAEMAEERGLDADRVNSMIVGGVSPEDACEKLADERVVPISG